MTIEPGQRVRALKSIYDPPSGDSPGGMLCKIGEELIVREVTPSSKFWAMQVSHEHILDSTFGVQADEVELIG